MEDLKETLKKQIIEALSLEEMTPEDITDDGALFGDGLGLDSIDALELIAEGKAILTSVNSMADYIAKNRTK